MIDLLEEEKFWEFVAEKNTIIQHKPTATDAEKKQGLFRFARCNDEGTIGETSQLGSPRLEMRDGPIGNFNGHNCAFIWDEMGRYVRVIKKVAANDTTAKKTAQNDCKKALAEIVNYIHNVQNGDSGDRCDSGIIRAFDVNSVQYEVIEKATADGTFTGVGMKLKFRASVKNTNPNYGNFSYP